jgi:hypothetical protein
MPVAFEGSSTPVAKKLSRLKHSRDLWKKKYAQLKLRTRVVEEQARWLHSNRDQWKATAEALQAQLNDQKKISSFSLVDRRGC